MSGCVHIETSRWNHVPGCMHRSQGACSGWVWFVQLIVGHKFRGSAAEYTEWSIHTLLVPASLEHSVGNHKVQLVFFL